MITPRLLPSALLLVTACSGLPPVEMAQTANKMRVLVPTEVVIAGAKGEAATHAEPQLAASVRDDLRVSLTEAGYEVVEDSGTERDLDARPADGGFLTGPGFVRGLDRRAPGARAGLGRLPSFEK